EDDPLVDDVGGQFRGRLLQHRLHGGDDLGQRLLHRLIDLGRVEHQVPRQAGHQVAPADLPLVVPVPGIGGADLDLELFRRTLADHQVEFLAGEADDRGVEGIAPDPEGTANDDAAQGQDRDVRCTAADVDDHVAAGLGDVEARAERG